MKRAEFVKLVLSGTIGAVMMDLKSFGQMLPDEKAEQRMPVLFIGHGSPMNALEKNAFTASLQKTGASIPRPKAILVVSAHWLTRGTYVSLSPKPETIYDFGGFPDELFRVKYPAPGAPDVARAVKDTLKTHEVFFDHKMGLDHGAWTILKWLYPAADVPVFQMSIDYAKPPQYHYELARELMALRSRGVLILGSGNLVHNLGMLDWKNPHSAYDWGKEFDELMKNKLDAGDHKSLIEYEKFGQAARLSVPTNDHYLPMLYSVGLQNKGEELKYIYEEMQMGSISMRSFLIG